MDIFLTKAIYNEDGYIDSVVNNIMQCPENEELVLMITCVGGDVFQGDRVYRAILEHNRRTKALVIGCAISMGAAMLSAFDEVEIDPGAEIMFHKARIEGVDPKDIDESQSTVINRFNKKTFARMKQKGVDAKFLSDVFLSEGYKDFWLSAKEAEQLGIGKVVGVNKSRYTDNFKVAASLDISKLKHQNKMNLFKKSVPRTVALRDGRIAIFESKNETLKVGDTLILANSQDKIEGLVELHGNLVAKLDEEGKVEDMYEEDEDEKKMKNMYEEEMEAMKKEIASIKEMMSKLMGDTEEEEMMEAKKEEDYEAKMEAANELLNKAIEAVNTIKTSFQPPRIDNKKEMSPRNDFSDLSESEIRAIEMKSQLKFKK